MTANITTPTDDVPPTRSLTDPAALAASGDVPVEEERFVHGTTDHCGIGTAGRAIVGVVDDGALLVLEHEDAPFPLLLNETVDPGGDWADVARRAGEQSAGVPVTLDAVRCVRHVDHALEGADPHQEGHHALFEALPATPVAEEHDPFPADCDWSPHWVREFPADLSEQDGVEADDVRRFLE